MAGQVEAAGGVTECGDDSWKAFKDEKCIKLIRTSVSKMEAETICHPEVMTTLQPLLSIHSREEQDFLSKWLYDDEGLNKPDNGTNNNIWLSAVREVRRHFRWSRGEPIDSTTFSNWAPSNPTVKRGDDCVQMLSPSGNWSNVDCSKKNFVVCQKPQAWRFARWYELQKQFWALQAETNVTREVVKDFQGELTRLGIESKDTRKESKDLKENLNAVAMETVSLRNDTNSLKEAMNSTAVILEDVLKRVKVLEDDSKKMKAELALTQKDSGIFS